MIETERLILRPWRDSDLPSFAELNADPLVMRYMLGPLTPDASHAWVRRMRCHLIAYGFCVWACEARGVSPLIGAVGLAHVPFEASFTPAVEVVWRLHHRWWGLGYATEAARAAIDDGFSRIGLSEIVAFTTLHNEASQRVMRRLGMTRSMEFDHPSVPAGHASRRHILCRLSNPSER
jgi:RimJ/RimL family protein N-acetyltransferase